MKEQFDKLAEFRRAQRAVELEYVKRENGALRALLSLAEDGFYTRVEVMRNDGTVAMVAVADRRHFKFGNCEICGATVAAGSKRCSLHWDRKLSMKHYRKESV